MQVAARKDYLDQKTALMPFAVLDVTSSDSISGSSTSGKVFTYEDLIAETAGNFMTPTAYRTKHYYDELIRQQSRDIADALEACGVKSRLDTNLTIVTDVTRQAIKLDAYRNVVFIPSQATRNRRPIANAVAYFFENEASQWWRYMVFTFGSRVTIRKMRKRLKYAKETMRKWRKEIKRKFPNVDFGLSGWEFTIDKDKTVHIHCNILIETPYFADGGKEFRDITNSILRCEEDANKSAVWNDAGRIKNINEVVKYPFKPVDLKHLDTRDFGDLFNACFRQHFFELHGSIKEMRAAHREQGYVYASRRGEVVLTKPKKLFEKAEIEPLGENCEDQTQDSEPEKIKEKRETKNILLARMRPSYFGLWAEGATLFWNYEPNTISERGQERLAEHEWLAQGSRDAWRAKGAPDGVTALAVSKAVIEGAENVRALWDKDASTSTNIDLQRHDRWQNADKVPFDGAEVISFETGERQKGLVNDTSPPNFLEIFGIEPEDWIDF